MLTLGLAMLLPALASAQYVPESRYPDPGKCRLVVEHMGAVGFRIADAQVLAERAMTAFRGRLGQDAVVYGGLLAHAKEMKRRLRGTETEIQDEQIAYYKAAAKAAPWRVKVRFGKKRGRHWIKATCHRVKDGKRVKKPVDSHKWEGKSFGKIKAQFTQEVKSFCILMDPPPPVSAKPPAAKRKKKEWKLPPMRN